jgi:hypothetical protein
MARDGRDALGGRRAGLATRNSRPPCVLPEADCKRRSVAARIRGPAVPSLSGRRAHPHADPDVRGAFVGLSLLHDRGALVRACSRALRSG